MNWRQFNTGLISLAAYKAWTSGSLEVAPEIIEVDFAVGHFRCRDIRSASLTTGDSQLHSKFVAILWWFVYGKWKCAQKIVQYVYWCVALGLPKIGKCKHEGSVTATTNEVQIATKLAFVGLSPIVRDEIKLIR